MAPTVDVDFLEINEELAQDSKLLASSLSGVQIRKRGQIDMLGINCAIDYLKSKGIRVNSSKSVFRIPLLYEEFKISDIYFGNHRIDVITLYKEKNVKIPKIHVDMDILPDFYFIVQIGAKIKGAKIIGFIEGKNIPACPHDSRYYYPTINMIIDTKRFVEIVRTTNPQKITLGKHIDCLGLFLKFIDNDLSSVYKRQLIQHLLNCDSCRSRFIDTIEFEQLANNVRLYPELYRKSKQNPAQNPVINVKRTGKESLEESIEHAIISKKPQTQKSEIKEEGKIAKLAQSLAAIDKSDKKLLTKTVIDSIFSDIPKIEFPPIKSVICAKNRRALIVCAASFLILASFALISLKGSQSVEQMNQLAAVEEYNSQDDQYAQDGYYLEEEQDAQNLPTLANIEDEDTAQPISTKPTYSPTVSKISFEAPSNIVDDASYTKFLQLIGKTIKLNLQNELLLVNDVPVNKSAKADIKIMANGVVNSVKITSSSGSNIVDKTILKVINETLSYMKPPTHGLVAKPALITLSLELN